MGKRPANTIRRVCRKLKRMRKSLKQRSTRSRRAKQTGGLGPKQFLMIKQRSNECYVDTLIVALLHYKNPEVIADFVNANSEVRSELQSFLASLSRPYATLADRERSDRVAIESFRLKIGTLTTNEELKPSYPRGIKLPLYDFSQPITLLNVLYEAVGAKPTIQGERTDVNLILHVLKSDEDLVEIGDEYAAALAADDYATRDQIAAQTIGIVRPSIAMLMENPDAEGYTVRVDESELEGPVSEIISAPYARKYPYSEQAISITGIYPECVSDALQMLHGPGVSATIERGGLGLVDGDDSPSRAMLSYKDISHLKSYFFVSLERQPGVEEHFEEVDIPVMVTSEIEGGDGVRIFFLVSMICYTENHFVCFVKADGAEDEWYLFNDMKSASERYIPVGSFSEMMSHDIDGTGIYAGGRAVFLMYSEISDVAIPAGSSESVLDKGRQEND